MKKPIYLILAIILLILIVLFTLQNTTEIDIKFLFWHVVASQVILIFFTFSFGVLLAVLLLLPTIIKLKKKLRMAKKVQQKIENKVSKPNEE